MSGTSGLFACEVMVVLLLAKDEGSPRKVRIKEGKLTGEPAVAEK